MAWDEIPTRTTSDTASAADYNAKQANENALKGGTAATAPTTTIEDLSTDKVDVSGTLTAGRVLAGGGSSTAKIADITVYKDELANGGSTYPAYDVTASRIIRIDTSVGSTTFQGFTGGVTGQRITIIKASTSNTLTLAHNNGSGTQKLLLKGAADWSYGAGQYGMADLQCDGSNWYVQNTG